MSIEIHAVEGLPLVREGDDLADLILSAIENSPTGIVNGDILAVCQKVVSKAEGRVVHLDQIQASRFAEHLAAQTTSKDPRAIETILRETKRIVKMDRGHLIVETGPGWICANAGVDESNCNESGTVILLPEDADRSARVIRDGIAAARRVEVAVIVTDTFGRPFREGLVDVALGLAGMDALLDYRGQPDLTGKELAHTVQAQADALAAAAGLLMGKGAGIPAVLIRGYRYEAATGDATQLVRNPELDLFR